MVTKSPFFHPSDTGLTETTTTTVKITQISQTPGGTKHRRTKSIQQHVTVNQEAKSTITGCVANLCNAIVGAGIVGIPYAISQTGIYAGVILIVICAIATEKSLRLLIGTAKHAHTATYETVAEAAFGSVGFQAIAIIMFINAYGGMLTYLMIIRDTFGTLLGLDEDDLPRRRAILWLISVLIVVPISCQRDMANLAKTSRITVLLDTLLVSVVAYNAPVSETVHTKMGGWWHGVFDWRSPDAIKPSTLFVGLGVFSFAFVCQHSAFLIAGSLHNPTQERWSRVTICALSFCCCLAMTAGLFGYLGYYDQTSGNILVNLPNNWTANAARAALGTAMLFVYPTDSFVTRHCCVSLFFQGRRAHEGNADADILQRADRRIGLTVALFLSAVIPASVVKSVGNVLAVTGAIGGSSLSYLGPGAIYLGIHGEAFCKFVQESKWVGAWYRNAYPSSKKKSAAPVTNNNTNGYGAAETTPLVAGGGRLNVTATANGLQETSSAPLASVTESEPSALAVVAQTILAYALCMPLWCSIAKFGKQSLDDHMHKLALKSPYPLRIGDVEYCRIELPASLLGGADRDDDSDDTQPLTLSGSLIKGNLALSTGSLKSLAATSVGSGSAAQSINQQIGKQLLEQQRLQQKTVKTKKVATDSADDSSDDTIVMEPDPQTNPRPYDFVVAIMFFWFGVVALVAGLGSIAIQQS